MSREQNNMSVAKAKEIIISFVKDYFRQDQVYLVESILKKCPVHIVDEQAMNETSSNQNEIYDKENVGAYATEEGIFLPKNLTHYNPNEEFDEDNTLSIIIHEYAHRFRKANSPYGNMFEEGFVTIFAEACLIHYKVKKQMQEGQEIVQPDIFVNSSWKYKKAESQIKAILYVLNQKGMDIELLGEYIFGNQDIFKQKCTQIFGKEFDKYFDLANSSIDEYYNDYDIKKQNSEILLTNILKNYISQHSLDLKKYWNRNYLFLYNRSSKTLAKVIVSIGESSIKECDREEYKLFESSSKIYAYEEKQEKEGRINRIRQLINEKYNLLGKSKEDIYSMLENLCSNYIQRKNSDKKENLIFLEEIKKVFPNIESLSKKFIEVRALIMSPSILDNLDLENISYSSIEECISLKLEQYKQKQIIVRIKAIFRDCTEKKTLMPKINELKNYEQIVDLSQIFPNYNDFIKFVSEMQDQIPDEIFKNKEWNYEKLYDEILKLYIAIKEQELIEDKSKEEEYKIVTEHISKQYKAVVYEENFIRVNEQNIKLNDDLFSKQKEEEEETKNRLQAEGRKRSLEDKKSDILNRNAIIRFFKKKQIKWLTSQITELEVSIQNSNLLLEQIKTDIVELRTQMKANEMELIDLCGLNISDYRKVLQQCKNEGLTETQLISKRKNIQQVIDSLNITEKEEYLLDLYKKNGLVKQQKELSGVRK